MDQLTRREILKLIGAGAVAAGCGVAPNGEDGASVDADEVSEAADLTAHQMLHEIDHFVILMMENRSFDHYMGALQRDKDYVGRDKIEGTNGKETNPRTVNGDERVRIHPAKTYRLKDPPHGFEAAHSQWDHGKNDRFVIEHEGPFEEQVMAYYDRDTIPFYYWLADNFAIFDHWHSSVMGPTIPNRLYLNAATSDGVKDNRHPITVETIWDQLANRRADKGGPVSAKSYHSGKHGLMAHALKNKKIPFAPMRDFWKAAKEGTLPHVSYMEPSYNKVDGNCDHPARDIALGQAFVRTVYMALAASPQWNKTLFVVLYDENGGFWDHVPPPEAEDHFADFRRLGFRVPAFAAGPRVKRGFIDSHVHDHASVIATLGLRFDLPDLTTRSANAKPILHVFEPDPKKRPDPPRVPKKIKITSDMLEGGEDTQPDADLAFANGEIPDEYVDPRSDEERRDEWLAVGEELGALELELDLDP